MKLSKRLKTIADEIETYKQGCILADIGTDHAYLPCYLVENHIITHAYACDVAKGPLESSAETIKSCGLEKDVTPLLGDGLEPIIDKDVDMISISGMGSFLMVEILDKNYKYLDQIKVMFLQPNANNDYLRSYLFEKNFQIIDEVMVKDAGHIYEVLVVIKQKLDNVVYSEEEIEFGPILIKNQPSLFKEKWQKQYKVYQNIMNDLPERHQRKKEIKHKIKLIKGVIHDCE